MKNYIKSAFGLLLILAGFTACEYEGIDPLTQVDPGPDEGAPEVDINYPNEGTTIQVPESVASINIRFEVIDDIEVDNIEVLVNNNLIASFDEFLDYRVVEEEVAYNEVTNGEHTLTVRATDLAGNVTEETVSFSKEPPYTPKYAGEFFYMPFDGGFTELVNIYEAEEIGNPEFSNNAVLGTGAYMGAEDSYLEIPLNSEELGSEFSGAFWYQVDVTNDRAGILTATDDDDRNQGFRLFREGTADEQVIKLNVGSGDGENWNDGAAVEVEEGEWVHIAFSITPEETIMYFNGMPVNTGDMTGAIDWNNVENLVVGSGLNFSNWGHNSDTSLIDELRLFNTALSQEDIQELINASAITLDMPFDGDYRDLVANRDVSVVGSPDFAGESVEGSDAYAGAEDSYLTMSSEGLRSEEFSGTFWYKVNADPDRAGIITISAEDEDNADYPDVQNDRTKGFRLFREVTADEQVIKLNVGSGDGENWNDGGAIDATAGDWVHIAFTISNSESVIYINGEAVNTGDGGIDWTGADMVSIMSGAPRFNEWGHLSDQSYLDELRFYNKALTQDEVQAAMAE